MIKTVKDKASNLIRNPSKIRYAPNFLNQLYSKQKMKIRGRTKKKVGSIESKFMTETQSEIERTHNLMNEEKVIEKILQETGTEDIFYDIGANTGIYSCYVGKKSNNLVYCYEPFPKNIESLEKNLEINDINSKILEVALMNENSNIKIDTKSGEAGEGKVQVSKDGKLRVRSWKGDDLIREENLKKPTIMKIDVEGAELEVLRGLEKTITESNPKIFIEIHKKELRDFGSSEKEVIEFLENLDYKLEKIEKEHYYASTISKS